MSDVTRIVVDGDVHVDDLRALVESLPAAQPVTDQFERDHPASTRYKDQREHLLGWLGEYNGPGAYGRKNPSTSGKHFYNHFRCAPGLLWLAEALGETEATLRCGVSRIEAAGRNPSSQCAAFRAEVPWSRIVDLVAERPAPVAGPSLGDRLRRLRKRDR